MNSALVIVLLVTVVGFAECKPHAMEKLKTDLRQIQEKRGWYSGGLYGFTGYMEYINILANCEAAWLTEDLLHGEENEMTKICAIAFDLAEEIHRGSYMEHIIYGLNAFVPLLQCINIKMSIEIIRFTTAATEQEEYLAYMKQAETMSSLCEIVYGNFEQEEHEFSEDMEEAENEGGDAYGEGSAEGESHAEGEATGGSETTGQEQQTTEETTTSGYSASEYSQKRQVLVRFKKLLENVFNKK